MDMQIYLKSAKDALADYTPDTSALETLYKNAKDRNTANYELSKAELNSQYSDDKSAAVVKSKLNEKDMGHFMAARGLTKSGESVQAKIDNNLSLGSNLSALAKQLYSSLTELLKQKNDTDSELDLSYSKDKNERDRWLTELTSSLAKFSAEFDQEEKRAAEALAEGEKNRQTTLSENQKDRDAAMERALLSASSKSSGSSSSTGTGSTGTGSSGSGTGSNSSDAAYEPKVSAKDLAKSIISTYGKDGSISTDSQRADIASHLDSLEAEGVSEAYMKDLLINLKAAGYYAVDNADLEIKSALDGAQSYYEKVRQAMYYDLKKSQTNESALKDAEEVAGNQRIYYLYNHCSSLVNFKKACTQLGLSTTDINSYLVKIKNIIDSGGDVSLGGKL